MATLVEGSTGQTLLTYTKLHTGSWHPERLFKRPSLMPPIVTLNGIKVSVVICYDLYFPELVRHLKRNGVQMVFCLWASTYDVVSHMSFVRAFENEIAVVSVNYSTPYLGGSCAIDDLGRWVTVIDKEAAALVVVDMEVHDVRSGREWDPVGDMCPELGPRG